MSFVLKLFKEHMLQSIAISIFCIHLNNATFYEIDY